MNTNSSSLASKYEAILIKLKIMNLADLYRNYCESKEYQQLVSNPHFSHYTYQDFETLKKFIILPHYTTEMFKNYLESNGNVQLYESFYTYLINNVMTASPVCELTHDNLLEQAVKYYKLNYDPDEEDLDKAMDEDIVDVLRVMLSSPDYILSREFAKNKLDLQNMQTKFAKQILPRTYTYDAVISRVFGKKPL